VIPSATVPRGDARKFTSRGSAYLSGPPTSRSTCATKPARRFWPLQTGAIDLDRLRRDRGLLLAEAVVRFRRGERWWPEAGFEQQTITTEQEARYEPDAWEAPIADFLASLPEDLTTPKRTTILAIAVGALDYEMQRPAPHADGEPAPVRGTPINRLAPRDQHRITAVLTHLGWEPKRNERERWWQPKTQEKCRK
jgi:putative DNA primase/helicase